MSMITEVINARIAIKKKKKKNSNMVIRDMIRV